MPVEVVPSALDGERVDRIVAFILDVSRSVAADLVESGTVLVDGVVETSGKVRLVEGQEVTVDPSHVPGESFPEPDPSVQVSVLYADDEIIVVDKQAGLVVHPGAGNDDGTLVNGLLARYPEIASVGEPHRPGIIHRLDAGSTGLLVVARTQQAYDALVPQFADHSATRMYRALVWGHPTALHGVIDAPIGRSRRDPLKMAVVADGRDSRTEYQVVERYAEPVDCSLLECSLETGRTHQIRVHLSSIGHPLIGDPWYGQRRPTLGMERPFLHAAQLEFDHPASGERVAFSSELAADLQEMLSGLTPQTDDLTRG
jgi:23S rRNA pseudouridine1911/1915/1917 synthase